MRAAARLTGILLTVLLARIACPAMPAVIDTAHHYMKHSYDVLNYKLNLDLYSCYTSPYPDTFSGKEVITFRVDSALTEIRLNAVGTSLAIDSVSLSAVSFNHTNDTLTLVLDREYLPGEIVQAGISYRHKQVFDHAFYTTSGYLFTDCPPEGARKWFPCWDKPSDKATTDITVKVAATARLGSTGILADSTLTGDTLYYHWVNQDQVATYLVTLTSKNGYNVWKQWYHLYNHPSDSIPVRFYYQTGQNVANISQLITPLTDYFSGLFGDYPFEKIGFAVPSSQFPWGGMENQTMVNLYPGGFSDNQLIAHEHSHQWFGDLITCGTWADIWLNEGFGTFCQLLWVEHESGYSNYKSLLGSFASDFLPYTPTFPIYNPDWAIHTPPINLLYSTPVIYHKSACVLHQLRYVLGDSVFFRILKEYISDTNLRFRNAVTTDFINHANEASGQDLQWFFNEWIYQPGYPVYENTFDMIDLGNGNWEVNLKIDQVQTNTVFFTMPVEIRIQFSDLSDTLIKVTNNINNQLFKFSFSKQPSILIFDPNNNILLKKSTTVLGIEKKTEDGGYRLFQNEPNPCSGSCSISYRIPKPGKVKIFISDARGMILRTPVDQKMPKGIHQVIIPVDGLAPGVYIIRMESGSFAGSRKMIVSK